MEVPKRIDDCYFYYYSTCTKGDRCMFRHEPNALGCETVCFYWQQGECFNKQCKLRHMELKKNRKQIPCYWERQPGGCKKKYCSFRHLSSPPASEKPAATEPSNNQPPAQPPATYSNESEAPKQGPGWEGWQDGAPKPDENIKNASVANMPAGAVPLPYAGLPPQTADSLALNFRESDSESVDGSSPIKYRTVDLKIKSDDKRFEELTLLNRIQDEVAKFYDICCVSEKTIEMREKGRKLPSEYENLPLEELCSVKKVRGPIIEKSTDFKVLSLDEIRKLKRHSDTSENLNETKRKLFRRDL